jgi:hypothetical protein
MAFVNEYVSEENIKKYELEALYTKWLVWIPPRFRYTWTFDAERDSYYIPMKTGREEDSNQTRGVLYFKGIHWDVKVLGEEGSSLSFAENPYRQIWGMIHIKHPEGGLVPEAEIVPVLKEALVAYQVFGIGTPVGLNVLTRFTFS